jgi:hypothetical protein
MALMRRRMVAWQFSRSLGEEANTLTAISKSSFAGCIEGRTIRSPSLDRQALTAPILTYAADIKLNSGL